MSVTYTDMRTGEEYEQPAGIVLLSSYVFGNVQHMLLAGIGEPYDHATGKGVVGKNYAYQFEAGASAFFEDKELNPYLGLGRHGRSCIDDFNGENFDHARPGLLRRRLHRLQHRGRAADRRPHRAARHAGMGLRMEARDGEVVPPRRPLQHPRLGLCQPRKLLDLDPTYKDALGRPLIRLTYNPHRQRITKCRTICWASSKASSRR